MKPTRIKYKKGGAPTEPQVGDREIKDRFAFFPTIVRSIYGSRGRHTCLIWLERYTATYEYQEVTVDVDAFYVVVSNKWVCIKKNI